MSVIYSQVVQENMYINICTEMLKQMWQNANIRWHLGERYIGILCSILATFLSLKLFQNKKNQNPFSAVPPL